MTSLWQHELRIFLRQRIAVPALLLMLVLSAASVWAGLAEVSRQNAVIERIQPQQEQDLEAVASHALRDRDPGNAAYYTFMATWDRPSPLAFAALGQRDIAPYVLRVRALALEGQIHESENYNAELALPGRFDWAFVLTFIAPLILIVLLHDLFSSEREAGRLRLLRIMTQGTKSWWLRRIALRTGLLFTALVAPLLIAGLFAEAGLATFVLAVIAGLYFAFWVTVCMLVSRIRLSSVANASTLAASWLVLTLILPAMALLVINAAIPVRQGVELTLAQREAVHGGWDKPKQEILEDFFAHYPQFRGTKPVEGGFHWKWYYAFQHLGDLNVADQAKAYRSGLEARDKWTRLLAFILPPLATQVTIHRLAETDLTAQLAYQDRIRNYHQRLREFYYPYIFDERPFGLDEFKAAPRWPE